MIQENKRRRRGLFRRWRALLITFVALGLGVFVDNRMKDSAPHSGFCPPEAACTIAAADFGRFWQGVEATPSHERFTEMVPQPLESFELAVRKATGIRPTASRWRVWMGKRFLWARGPQGIGLCVYPGLLMRGVDVFRGMILRVPEQDGISRFQDWHYAWRDGYLLLSPSRDYVVAALASAGPASVPESNGGRELRVSFMDDDLRGTVRLVGEDSLPISGTLDISITPRDKPLTSFGSWSEPPMAALTVSNAADLASLWRPCAGVLDGFPLWNDIRAVSRQVSYHWGLGTLPDNWDRSLDEISVALRGVDVSTTVPTPELACILRCPEAPKGAHPLTPLMDPLKPVAYEWHGSSGLLGPLLGERFSICLGRDSRDWLAATQESSMTALANESREGAPLQADAALTIDWSQVGEVADALISKAGRMELFPRKNGDEANRDYGSIARGLSGLGMLEITCNDDNGRMSFEGVLSRVVEQPEEGQ